MIFQELTKFWVYSTAVHFVFEGQTHKHMESADFTEDVIKY